jgi:hypothetical protein
LKAKYPKEFEQNYQCQQHQLLEIKDDHHFSSNISEISHPKHDSPKQRIRDGSSVNQYLHLIAVITFTPKTIY